MSPPSQQTGNDDKGGPDGGPGLSKSQELDSGVGRSVESTWNEESSEHDLLGDEPAASPTPWEADSSLACKGMPC